MDPYILYTPNIPKPLKEPLKGTLRDTTWVHGPFGKVLYLSKATPPSESNGKRAEKVEQGLEVYGFRRFRV